MFLVFKKLKDNKHFYKIIAFFVIVITVLYSINHLSFGRALGDESDFFINSVIGSREKIKLEKSEFYRIDTDNVPDNLGMFLNTPSIHTFNSIVPHSIMRFYSAVGVDRSVASRPELKYYGLRPFLSVKYLFVKKGDNIYRDGYKLNSSQNGFDIYDVEDFIKMGFSYKYFITESDFERIDVEDRHKYLVKYL